MLHVAGSFLFNCCYRHSSWWNVYNFCTTYDGFQRYNILLHKFSFGVLDVVNNSSNISFSSCCPHLLLYKVMRPAFKPIGDKVCSWTLSSSPWHCSHPRKNVKRVPTRVCQPHALAFLFMEFDITWTRETSFPRFLKFLATLLSVCAKYDNVCRVEKSSLESDWSNGGLLLHVVNFVNPVCLTMNSNELLMTSNVFVSFGIARVPSESSDNELKLRLECWFASLKACVQQTM